MRPNSTKRTAAIVLVLLVLVIGVFGYISSRKAPPVTEPIVKADTGPKHAVIGQSVNGHSIDTYTYGHGSTTLIFVGGIHGGYEWNSVFLAYRFMDYLTANPDIIPQNISVTVIPSVNPDGVYMVTGKEGRFAVGDVSTSSKVLAKARFNANNIDLNRNFDCKWQPKSTWQSKVVSAGTKAFSEPEASALRDYILPTHPAAVVFWHSQSNGVYASQCKDGILPGTLGIMEAYSKASLYPAIKTFDAYATTGAADDWLAAENIPAITVELKTHETIEWDRNLAGVKALFGYFSEKRI